MLPENILNIHNHPFVRIFRVVVGISIVTVLSKKYLLLFLPFKFVVLFLALLHFIYISSISCIKLWYGFKVLRSDKLDIKNSPFDQVASATGKLLYCWKFGYQATTAGVSKILNQNKTNKIINGRGNNLVSHFINSDNNNINYYTLNLLIEVYLYADLWFLFV